MRLFFKFFFFFFLLSFLSFYSYRRWHRDVRTPMPSVHLLISLEHLPGLRPVDHSLKKIGAALMKVKSSDEKEWLQSCLTSIKKHLLKDEKRPKAWAQFADEYFEKADDLRAVFPKSFELHLRLATYSHLLAGLLVNWKLPQAERYLVQKIAPARQLVSDFPREAEAHMFLAHVIQMSATLGSPEEVKFHLEECLKINPHHQICRDALIPHKDH